MKTSVDVKIAEEARRESEYGRKYRMLHHEDVLERKKRYRIQRLLSLSDVELAEEARERSEHNRVYRKRNKERLSQNAEEYRETHREERRLYDKLRQESHRNWGRERRLFTTLNGKMVTIRGILKREYPPANCCELCGKLDLRLVYHHWEGTETILCIPKSDAHPVFLKGIWVCQPCNIFIHRLTEFPFIVEKWFTLKETVEKKK